MEIEKLKKEIDENYSSEKYNSKNILDEIVKLLKWRFIMIVGWIFDEKIAKEIFNFLTNKKRTCRLILDQSGAYSVETPLMDRDFLKKYYDKLFNPREHSYFFDDSAKTIEIFEGGLRIKNK
ncbi:MAG: hypothetical protein AABX28_03800 [Nanoarchaeota archaeon]